MSLLSPSAIFSPTLARQALATTKDWNYIDGWLSRHFSPHSPPPFERNAETLKALLALAAANEAADEERELQAKVDAKALEELKKYEATELEERVLGQIEDGLTKDGKASLQTLAETAEVLNMPLASTEDMAKRIVDWQVSSHSLERVVARVTVLQAHLEKELETVSALLQELEVEDYQPSPTLVKQSAEYQRKAKLLAAKLPELRDRAEALAMSENNRVPNPSIRDIEKEEARYREAMAKVKDLEAQVKSYHGLPHDTSMARQELERLRDELQMLMKERDGMFEGLVERESPFKQRPQRR